VKSLVSRNEHDRPCEPSRPGGTAEDVDADPLNTHPVLGILHQRLVGRPAEVDDALQHVNMFMFA
jgi:hypothetical protein